MRQLNRLSKQLFNDYISHLESSLRHNPRLFWSFVKAKKSLSDIPDRIFYNQQFAQTALDKANLFASFFENNFSDFNGSLPTSSGYNCESSVNIGCMTLLEADVELALSSLNNSCKSDIDGFSPFCLLMCSVQIIRVLTLLFNLSLGTGIFPDDWKIASICPLFKKGDKCNVSNYRPIAKLSTIAKLFEITIKNKLSCVLKILISPNQHGFMQGRSTISNLAVFTRHCYESLLTNKQVDVIYTDFAKAFDSVSHDILLAKMFALGFHSIFLSWIMSYLTNRKCFVTVDGYSSSDFIARSGVPQGSVLGPILFILFINDIGCGFKFCNYVLYADDIKLYFPVNDDNDRSLVQHDLDELSAWCLSNQLFLNVDKCFVMSLSRSRTTYDSSYSINGHRLCSVSEFKDLGVVFDSCLTFVNHVNYIIPKAKQSLGFLFRHAKHFTDPYAIVALYSAYVRSKLEYASFIWNPFFMNHVSRLESIQNKLTKFALRSTFNIESMPTSHARNLLLGLKSLEVRRNIFSLLFVFDVINGSIDCPSLLSSINFLVPAKRLRHHNIFDIKIAKTNFAANEPISRYLNCFNNLPFVHLLDFSISKASFRQLLFQYF